MTRLYRDFDLRNTTIEQVLICDNLCDLLQKNVKNIAKKCENKCEHRVGEMRSCVKNMQKKLKTERK